MSKVYRTVLEVCWALGVVSLVVSLVVRLLVFFHVKPVISPYSGMLLTAACFLGVLATGEARKTPPTS